MTDRVTQETAVTAAPSERWTDAAVDAVCERFAPFWPLDAMVATNPYLGFVGQHFDSAAEYHRRIIGRPMTMNREWFREQIAAGRITDEDLQEALLRSGADLDLAALKNAVAEPVALAIPQLLYSHMRDGRYRPSHSGYVVQQTSQFCAAYYDLGQAIWPLPRFGDGLYNSWWHYTCVDRSPRGMDIRNADAAMRTLPDSPRDAIQAAVERMDVPQDRLEDFLYVALSTVGGWASYTRHLRWVAEMEGGRNDDIVDLLAIRVAWEALLVATCERPAHRAQWLQSLRCWPRELRPEQGRALKVNLILQRALEIGYQRRLVAGLRGASSERPAAAAPRPVAQAAFCIDVRSEVFRRALETADNAIETQGFAGFFGIMAEYRPLGAGRSQAHLPVLLPPRYRVCESAGDGGGPRTEAVLARRKQQLSLSKAWKYFKLSSASCFSFVESAGLLYVFKLVSDSFGWTRPVPHPDAAGLGRGDASALGPDLDATPPTGEEERAGWGIPRDERADVAAFILNAMGLKSRFAPIVLLAGHGSSTVNNPQRAGLDCGACAGQTGEASVRMAALILNDPAVRAALAERGQPIPDDTWFVPALHDTTTDEVHLLDTASVPTTLRPALDRLRSALERAGDIARLERLQFLDEPAPADGARALRAVRQRGNDWSQLRPEWGLAGNASFFAVPRARTAHLSLEGRAFLHEYDWRQDVGFEVLKLIMSAPMVVANWINLQYYGSTVDHDHLGAGNKVLHNVVGGSIGVLEGNGGDLRLGLALQSLHDGRRWVHEPLRLSVFIEAPAEAIDEVIAGNTMVHDLVTNEWLHLFRVADDGEVLRRLPDGGWQLAPGA
ncbi:MAG: DUF2309 domain-containing protein [Xanthomonadales bacterium]|jgi:uncharacterized protein YbcC (UPF0753/DUF2309 family)|nr:DUF2309 domain-containing protein [Xanthomonadales bacterium]